MIQGCFQLPKPQAVKGYDRMRHSLYLLNLFLFMINFDFLMILKQGMKGSASLKFNTEKEVFDFLGFPWLEPNERNLWGTSSYMWRDMPVIANFLCTHILLVNHPMSWDRGGKFSVLVSWIFLLMPTVALWM